MTPRPVLAALALVACAAAGPVEAPLPPVPPSLVFRAAAEVAVTDGDTLRIGAERVRILGYDSAELRARCPAELALAEAARDELAAMIAAAGGIGLARDRSRRDRHGRTLAVILIDGADIAPAMIARPHSRAYDGSSREGWCR